MAKIHEEYIVIKVSKLVADSDDGSSIIPAELQEAIVEVAKELVAESVGKHVIVEAASASE